MMNQPPTGPEFSTGDFVKGYLSAFGNVFAYYYPGVTHLARELVHDNTVAASIVTDSFLKLWIKHADLNSPQNIEAFLHISVQRSCFSYLKQVERLTDAQLLRMQEAVALATAPHKEINAEALKAIIMEWFNMLPPTAAQVAQLAWGKGLAEEQVAEQLHTSTSHVKDQKIKSMLLIMEQWLGKTEKEQAAFRQLLEKAGE